MKKILIFTFLMSCNKLPGNPSEKPPQTKRTVYLKSYVSEDSNYSVMTNEDFSQKIKNITKKGYKVDILKDFTSYFNLLVTKKYSVNELDESAEKFLQSFAKDVRDGDSALVKKYKKLIGLINSDEKVFYSVYKEISDFFRTNSDEKLINCLRDYKDTENIAKDLEQSFLLMNSNEIFTKAEIYNLGSTNYHGVIIVSKFLNIIFQTIGFNDEVMGLVDLKKFDKISFFNKDDDKMFQEELGNNYVNFLSHDKMYSFLNKYLRVLIKSFEIMKRENIDQLSQLQEYFSTQDWNMLKKKTQQSYGKKIQKIFKTHYEGTKNENKKNYFITKFIDNEYNLKVLNTYRESFKKIFPDFNEKIDWAKKETDNMFEEIQNMYLAILYTSKDISKNFNQGHAIPKREGDYLFIQTKEDFKKKLSNDFENVCKNIILEFNDLMEIIISFYNVMLVQINEDGGSIEDKIITDKMIVRLKAYDINMEYIESITNIDTIITVFKETINNGNEELRNIFYDNLKLINADYFNSLDLKNLDTGKKIIKSLQRSLLSNNKKEAIDKAFLLYDHCAQFAKNIGVSYTKAKMKRSGNVLTQYKDVLQRELTDNPASIYKNMILEFQELIKWLAQVPAINKDSINISDKVLLSLKEFPGKEYFLNAKNIKEAFDVLRLKANNDNYNTLNNLFDVFKPQNHEVNINNDINNSFKSLLKVHKDKDAKSFFIEIFNFYEKIAQLAENFRQEYRRAIIGMDFNPLILEIEEFKNKLTNSPESTCKNMILGFDELIKLLADVSSEGLGIFQGERIVINDDLLIALQKNIELTQYFKEKRVESVFAFFEENAKVTKNKSKLNDIFSDFLKFYHLPGPKYRHYFFLKNNRRTKELFEKITALTMNDDSEKIVTTSLEFYKGIINFVVEFRTAYEKALSNNK